jgi:predicted NUDIX family NTP pyrophosphohydrolase
MAKTSVGILLYRRAADGLNVLLIHPGGPFWASRDAGAWSIPKGEIDAGETPRDAALREFTEELGTAPSGEPWPLADIRQRGGKRVIAFALEGDFDIDTLRSNTFELEWPPRSGRIRSYPEVDKAAWLTLSRAHDKMLESQRPLLESLANALAGTVWPQSGD